MTSMLLGSDREKDPHGKAAHEPGAKNDLGKVRFNLIQRGFARALLEVGRVATFGANKYTPDGWASVPNGIERYTDALYRHMNAEARGEVIDSETGLSHAAATAWNALARLELMHREKEAISILEHVADIPNYKAQIARKENEVGI